MGTSFTAYYGTVKTGVFLLTKFTSDMPGLAAAYAG